MLRSVILLPFVVALIGPVQAAARPQTLSVHSAVGLCAPHRSRRLDLRVHGWFVPLDLTPGGEDGVLFSGNQTPTGLTTDWRYTHWLRLHRAILLHVRTRQTIPTGMLTIAGRLNCASLHMVAVWGSRKQ